MPSKSARTDLQIPNVDLWTFLLGREKGDEDKPLFIDVEDERRYVTRKTLRAKSQAFGNALRTTWNWQKGDVLAIFGPNDVDWGTAVFGTAWAGGVVTTISFTLTAEELAYQLRNSSTKAILVHELGLKTVQQAARLAGLPQHRILLFGKERNDVSIIDSERSSNYKHFLQLQSSGPAPSRYAVDPKNDVVLLVYSSGTTGFPKGVRLTHYNMVAQCAQIAASEIDGSKPGYDTKLLAFLPLAHIYSITEGLLRTVIMDIRVVIMPKFDFEKVLAAIQKFRITYIYVAPPILLLLARNPLVKKYDLSSVGGIMSAAAPLAPQLIEEIYEKFQIPVKQAYGMSETAPAVTHQTAWDDAMKFKGSVGKLLANTSAKWMSPESKELSKGQEGELWLKGPQIFIGYHDNAEATKNSFSEDGWFKTGDVGFEDEHGNFYITDRVKELIKYKGYQVAPAELEALLLKNPKVRDVAVLGMYVEEMASEVPRAFIVPEEGLKPSPELEKDIVDWMNAQVSHPKKLRGGVEFVDEVPKSPTGKILRRLLKDKYGSRISSAKSKL